MDKAITTPGAATAGKLKVKLLSDKARLPSRGSKDAAGYDLYSAKTVTIPARGKCVVPTDLSIALPEGTYGRVAPRSGLAVKNFVDVGAGVIDRDYRGPLGVLLFNFSEQDFEVKEGDRMAQLILEKYMTAEIEQVDDLDATDRGEGGFGSTGVSLSLAENATAAVVTGRTVMSTTTVVKNVVEH